ARTAKAPSPCESGHESPRRKTKIVGSTLAAIRRRALSVEVYRPRARTTCSLGCLLLTGISSMFGIFACFVLRSGGGDGLCSRRDCERGVSAERLARGTGDSRVHGEHAALRKLVLTRDIDGDNVIRSVV